MPQSFTSGCVWVCAVVGVRDIFSLVKRFHTEVCEQQLTIQFNQWEESRARTARQEDRCSRRFMYMPKRMQDEKEVEFFFFLNTFIIKSILKKKGEWVCSSTQFSQGCQIIGQHLHSQNMNLNDFITKVIICSVMRKGKFDEKIQKLFLLAAKKVVGPKKREESKLFWKDDDFNCVLIRATTSCARERECVCGCMWAPVTHINYIRLMKELTGRELSNYSVSKIGAKELKSPVTADGLYYQKEHHVVCICWEYSSGIVFSFCVCFVNKQSVNLGRKRGFSNTK